MQKISETQMKSKIEKLNHIIADYRSVAIAFSGGVDSTLLAAVAKKVLGKENVILVTANSPTFPQYEFDQSRTIADFLDLQQLVIDTNELQNRQFSINTPQRCYYCKMELFLKIKETASERGVDHVIEGSNHDDLSDYRPGLRAINELGIKSPLCESGLTKSEIRQLSSNLHLPTANKPSMACLSSRFPYGEEITEEKLKRVALAEDGLRELGFVQFRVRSHGTLARIEIGELQQDEAWRMRDQIGELCRSAGFTFSALDLRGYRTGAMNEALSTP